MTGKHKILKYKCYIIEDSKPVTVDSLTPEQKENALEALWDSFMISQGYEKLVHNPEQEN